MGNAVRCHETGTMIAIPVCPYTGRSTRKAWERGFDWRACRRPGEVARNPYQRAGLRECFQVGYDMADRIIKQGAD